MAQISLRLSDELHGRLRAEAEALSRPVSWVVVQALEAALGSPVAGQSFAAPPDPAAVPARASKAEQIKAERDARAEARRLATPSLRRFM